MRSQKGFITKWTLFAGLLAVLLFSSQAKAKPQVPGNEGPLVVSTVALFPVLKDGKWGYINTEGHLVIPPQFDAADPFSEGLAAVKMGSRAGYINEKGVLAINPLFDDAYSFSQGMALVKIGKKWGYIGKDGQYIWEPSK